jgi:all-trans-retinol 13,14-reductase
MNYDFVVIGAGVSGLSTAIILAQNGYHVALVEKAKKPAPLIRGFTRHGVYFDTGFHYTGSLGDGEILDALFHYLGLSDRLEKVPFEPDGFDLIRCRSTGFELRFPYGYERIRERLLEAFPHESRAINEYLQTVKDTFNSFPYLNLNPDLLDSGAPKGLNGPSLKDFLDRLTTNEALKWVLSIHCLLHGVPPEEAPLAFHACIAGSYYESVHGIKGGGRSLTKAYESQLEKLGVDVYCGQGVSEIIFSPDTSPAGIRLQDGEILNCRGCISTVHPIEFLNLVPTSAFRPAYRKRLMQLEDTIPAHILYLAIRAAPEMLTRNNLVVTSDWDLTGLWDKDPLNNRPLYVCSSLPEDSKGTRPGLIGIVPASRNETDPWSQSMTGKRPQDYHQFKDKIAFKLRQYIERSIPELAGNIEHAECATALTLRDFTHTPIGSLYGVKHRIGQYNPLPLTKAKNLFLAGQAIVAPGIMGAIISAFLVCGFIIGHKQLLNQIQKYR